VIAGIGVTGLTVVANQYRKALAKAEIEDASSRAARLVDGYLAARDAVKGVIAQSPDLSVDLPADAKDAYRRSRFEAFSAHGMTYEDYAVVRTAWRIYRAGGSVNDPALLAALRAKRAALAAASLGPVEAVDDAIR
jgi:hypothetical protein